MQKLLYVQQHLIAKKDKFNSFGKYNYRSAESIIESVKPLLVEQGLLMTITDDIVNLGDRYYVKSTVKILDIENKDSIEFTAFAREDIKKTGMDLSQLTGSCSSYAKKYALQNAFLLDDGDDADAYDNRQSTGGKNSDKIKKTFKAEELAGKEQIDAFVKFANGHVVPAEVSAKIETIVNGSWKVTGSKLDELKKDIAVNFKMKE